MPIPSASPDMEMMFMEISEKYIRRIVNSTLSGIDTATTSVGRKSLRNSRSTRNARIAPQIRLENTELIMTLIYSP